MRLSVIGLGKLGSPLAAVLASKGHDVTGVDLNPEFVGKLSQGRAPVQEPQLQELLDRSRDRLRATTSYEEAIHGTDLSFVIVPTPSDSHGVFTNKHVIAAIREIGAALRTKAGYHVVTVTSTVMPGSTGGEIREALEAASGREVGVDVGLCYNPEFIALGSVIRDLLFPDAILIGESDTRAGDLLERVYRSVCERNPPVHRMNFVNAELTKIAINTFVTTKISYANMLADICDRLPGANVDVVTAALGVDSRIGGKYLKGAIGYGGPCFPRDNIAFSVLARSLGALPELAEATDRINRYQIDRLEAAVRRLVAPGASVAILGLSYKPDTAVIEASQGVMLVERLAMAGYHVRVFDPLATQAAASVLGPKAVPTDSIEACISDADLVVIATAWPEFKALPKSSLTRSGRRTLVLDCWRILDRERHADVAEIIHLGYGDDWTERDVANPAKSASAA